MAQQQKTTIQSSSEGLTLWKLIEMEQYDQIAQYIEELLATNQQADNQALAHILTAARLTCWACRQYQLDIERHRQATEEATRRRNELNQQLYLILNQIDRTQNPEPDKSLTSSPPPRLPSKQLPALLPPEPPKQPPLLSIYCLGPFRVYQNERLINGWSSLKARAILKYLLIHREIPVAKEILMDIFWPEADLAAARRNLHQAIYTLRQALTQGYPDLQPIQFENDAYRLNPLINLWLDYAEFETHLKAGQRLEKAGQLAEAMTEYALAASLYQGDFLEEDLYDDWPVRQREYLRLIYLDLVNRLADYYLQQRRYPIAVKLCQRILTCDNCHEQTHHRLITCYLAQGQRSLAIRQYQTCLHTLKTELDLPPSTELQNLYQQITTGTTPMLLPNTEERTLSKN